ATEPPPAPAEPAQPAAAAVAAPEPVAAAAPAQTLPSGVTHGTTGGTRLRPEDEVSTESQFEGQQAMYERRRLIDELVATGVPSVAASGTGRARAPWLALFYLIIPIVVVVLLVNNNSTSAAPPTNSPSASAPASGGGLSITAHNVAFDTSELNVPAAGGTLSFVNQDSTTHNFAIFKDKSATDQLFKSPDVGANQTVEIDIPKLDKGSYYFECQYHPTSMNGTLTVK
ncbi:MAG: cupredoxin domain-containing protein, partial [Actinomycetota bacterium]